MAKYFKGKRVSPANYNILMEAERRLRDVGGVALNSGQRTMSEQARLVREKGLYNASTNPGGAAWPSPDAPHIWEGRQNHALDIDTFVGAGITRVRQTIATMAKEKHLPINYALTVSTEPWHTQDYNEPNVLALAAAYPYKPSILDRLRHSPLRPGNRSINVIAVQIWMRRAGLYRGAIAKNVGTYGPALRAAVKRFQRRVGLKIDGIVGPQTAAAMRRRYGINVIKNRKERKQAK